MAFWNVAGLKNKSADFWTNLKEWEVIGLTEIWVEEKDWDTVRGWLPGGYSWKCQPATREHRKGRPAGGIITGVRKETTGEEKGEEERTRGLQWRKIKTKHEEHEIATIYVRDNWQEIRNKLNEKLEENRGRSVIIGDFNARTAGEGGREIFESGEKRKRESKDKEISYSGKRMIEWVEEEGLHILNGVKEGDEAGEFTYVGPRGATVIDCAIANEEAERQVDKFEIKDRIESDHIPLQITMRGEMEQRTEGKSETKIWVIYEWGKEEEEEYNERCKMIRIEDEEATEMLRKLTEEMKGAMIKKETGGGRNTGRKSERWWDEECWKKKKEARRKLKKWRRKEGDKSEYLITRNEYRKTCEKKREEENERYLDEIKNIRREENIWKVINRKRKRKAQGGEKIKEEEWLEHFKKMLGGGSANRVGEERKTEEEEEDGEQNITREEIERAIKKMKRKKAPGADGVPNEAWMAGGEQVKEVLRKILNKIWRGESSIPEGWKTGVVVPIHKKGDKEKVGNYRGITLMDTSYKVYAEVLRNRLEGEPEEKEVIPDNQVGFRKGIGTTDNIYIRKHAIDRKIERKEKVFALFADLKAAFDVVERREIWKMMKKKKISRNLRRRIEDLYKETKCEVRGSNKSCGSFNTYRGVRQGCPLSPTVFNIYTADLERTMRKGQDGGIIVGRKKFWTLL